MDVSNWLLVVLVVSSRGVVDAHVLLADVLACLR